MTPSRSRNAAGFVCAHFAFVAAISACSTSSQIACIAIM
jgi:hypothetical protein